MTNHARIRALERYGIRLEPEDVQAIQDQITSGRAIKLGRKGYSTSIYLVTVQEQDAVIVYNRKAKCVITFLPLEWEKRSCAS